jgi:protein-L-isoaspartate O-methyltransferase
VIQENNGCRYRRYFVNALIERGILRSPALKQAFFMVPRDAFIEYYYEQEGSSLVWTRIEAPGIDASQEQQDVWYRTIYSDKALVTQIDEQGMPSSSSSMPSVMVMMLEALNIQPYEPILEIGTGTGYNCALLAYLARETSAITSLEVDAELAEKAQRRLNAVLGKGGHVCACDALQLVAGETTYKKIIVTGSFPTIPASWVRMLAPNGLLVMDLRGDFAGGLVRVQKQADGSARGTFLPEWNAAFMPLYYSHQTARPRPLVDLNEPVVEQLTLNGEFSPDLFFQRDVGLWFQCTFPSLRIRRHYHRETKALAALYMIDQEHKTTVVVEPDQQQWHVTTYGTYQLWSQLYSHYQRWQAGKFKLEQYQVHMHPQNDYALELVV